MAALPDQVFTPSSLSELFSIWERFPEAMPYAGGTCLLRSQGKQILELPGMILTLDKIKELGKITRTERYLEIGAMVKLNQIMLLGKIIPEALKNCLGQIASPQLRNIATIGGNICNKKSIGKDAIVPLIALDAQYELCSSQLSRWISAARFSPGINDNALNKRELLTRIRIPLEQWDYPVYRKFAFSGNYGSSVVFMIKNQKSVLTDIRLIFRDGVILRDKDSESILIGKQLPLSAKIAADFLDKWDNYMANNPEINQQNRRKLLNFIDFIVQNLSE